MASSDLAHGHDYQTTRRLDATASEAIQSFSHNHFYDLYSDGACEACGGMGLQEKSGETEACGNCAGKGKVEATSPCSACGGEKLDADGNPCASCTLYDEDGPLGLDGTMCSECDGHIKTCPCCLGTGVLDRETMQSLGRKGKPTEKQEISAQAYRTWREKNTVRRNPQKVFFPTGREPSVDPYAILTNKQHYKVGQDVTWHGELVTITGLSADKMVHKNTMGRDTREPIYLVVAANGKTYPTAQSSLRPIERRPPQAAVRGKR